MNPDEIEGAPQGGRSPAAARTGALPSMTPILSRAQDAYALVVTLFFALGAVLMPLRQTLELGPVMGWISRIALFCVFALLAAGSAFSIRTVIEVSPEGIRGLLWGRQVIPFDQLKAWIIRPFWKNTYLVLWTRDWAFAPLAPSRLQPRLGMPHLAFIAAIDPELVPELREYFTTRLGPERI